eukprot:scaffold1923_cov160-Amphora_coffeaeformis.AAC.4
MAAWRGDVVSTSSPADGGGCGLLSWTLSSLLLDDILNYIKMRTFNDDIPIKKTNTWYGMVWYGTILRYGVEEDACRITHSHQKMMSATCITHVQQLSAVREGPELGGVSWQGIQKLTQEPGIM